MRWPPTSEGVEKTRKNRKSHRALLDFFSFSSSVISLLFDMHTTVVQQDFNTKVHLTLALQKASSVLLQTLLVEPH